MKALLIATFVASVALSACSSEEPNLKLDAGKVKVALKSVFKRKSKKPPSDPSVGLSRDSLKGIGGPLLFAHLEKSGAFASLSLSGDSQGVKTFLTTDNVSLSTRHGVILASRGLVGDLISADVSGTVSAIKSTRAAGYKRIMRWLDGEDQTVTSEFTCSMANAGSKKKFILGTGFSTIHLKESCKSGKTTFVNDYWRASGSPLIWQSYQWMGPLSGYIDLQLWVR